MIGLNKVILIGKVGKSPSFSDANGNKCVNFNLGTSRSWLDSNGVRKEHTEWHKVVAFGKLSDIFQNYVKEGQYIYIEGSLKTNSWKDRSGVVHKDVYVNANNIIMLGAKDSGENRTEAYKQAYVEKSLGYEEPKKKTYSDKNFGEMEIEGDDIPF